MAWSERLRGLALGSSLIVWAQAGAATSAHEWLDRMSQAVRELDYEGRFVVQSGDRLDAMYLVHRVDDGIEKERMVSLTGNPREVIRSDQAVACLISGRNNYINIRRRPKDQTISPLHGISGEDLARNYRMQVLDAERVAGRSATQILIEPNDGFRYGYRVYIDDETALPLRSVVLDESDRLVSQVMFVDIQVGDRVTPVELDVAAMRIASVDQVADSAQPRSSAPAWQVSELPQGYRLSDHRSRAVDGGELEHFIYSDGLATFSVYVQPASEQGLAGESRFGSSTAVGRVVDGHEVIVVGEVPMQTLRWVADRVVPATQ